MGNGFKVPRSLSDTYVYYNHLKETYPDLHDKLKNDLETTAFSFGGGDIKGESELAQTASKLMAMANAERKKEQAFLKHTFGITTNFSLNSGDDFKNFEEAFNRAMQLEQVYEANKALILTDVTMKKEKGQEEGKKVNAKNAYTYFSEYFASSFMHPNRVKKMARRIAEITEKNPSLPIEKTMADVINEEIPAAVESALTKLEKVGGLSNIKNVGEVDEQEDETIIKGYRQIADAINHMGKNAFGQMIIRELGLKNTIDKVIEEFKIKQTNKSSKGADLQSFKSAVKKGTRYLRAEGKHILGGNMLELVENVVINEVGKLKGENFYAVHTGNKLAKPDNIIVSASIKENQFREVLEKAFEEVQNKKVSRKRNIEAAKNLQNSLEKLDTTGYIIYSSAKNQSINSQGFNRGGFNSGTPMGIKELQTVMKLVPGGNGLGLARAVMQTLKGAIGEKQKKNLETEIASYLAFFLFDDFQTIGNEIANSSQTKINCLHVMNLNGIYVPLSVLLGLLAKAFQSQTKGNIDSIAKVTISTKPILYNYEKNPPILAPGETSIKYWNEQRDIAQQETKITVKFLKSFKELMATLKT